MAGNFGGSVKLQGESEYRKALREITSNLKEVSSELKLTSVQFQSGDKTLKNTKTSYDNMNSTIKKQDDKVEELRKTLKAMENQYGANNEKVRELRTQLNNAEAQLVKMENETNKSNKELKEMKNSFENAGQGAVKFGDLLKANVIGDVIVSGLKAAGTAIKEISTKIGEIAIESLNARGELEQQVGGIETLFKESSDTVINNANNAYKTAGLSAIDYMSTATSFSASLLQSLNNDTVKVAEVTDMAIIDMSDNANKMGTSMESIQNAYQGFAKQNYTMLDNLKLGYGGTKNEMQRLLSDAQKISGTKYDISNLSDVYNAIHVIQGELGITGTTTKEATETLQGSMSSMKSAWNNFLSGSGNISQLVDGVKDVVSNVVRIANEAIPEMIEGITSSLPEVLQLGGEILNQLVSGIMTYLPELMDSATEMIMTFASTLIENLPTIIQTGLNIISSLIIGIAESLPTMIPTIVDTVITIAENLLDNIDLIIDAGIELIFGLADGLIEALPRLIEKIPEIITKIVEALIRNGPKIVDAGKKLNEKLFQGMLDSISSIGDVLNQLWQFIVDINKEAFDNMWNGIVSFFTEEIPKFVQSVIQWFEELPEKMGYIIGDMLGNFIKFGVDAWNWVTVDLPQIIQGIADWFKELPEKIWTWLLEAIVKINNWGTDMAQKGKDSAVNLIDNIINTIKELPQKMLDFGKNIVEGLWTGIQNATQWLKDKVASFANGILDGMKNALGIHSPSTVFRDEVGKFMAEGIGLGFENEMSNVTREMQNAIPTKFDIETTENLSYLSSRSNNEGKIDVLIGLLDEFLPQIVTSSHRNLILDSGELIGATANMFDTALGDIQIREKRGN